MRLTPDKHEALQAAYAIGIIAWYQVLPFELRHQKGVVFASVALDSELQPEGIVLESGDLGPITQRD